MTQQTKNTPDAPAESPDDSAVTVTIRQRVRAGRERDFEDFLRDIVQEAWRFAGFNNAHVTRPPRGGNEYRIVLRYDSREHLRAWLDSDQRAQFEERRADLIEDAPLVRDITGTSQERALALRVMPLGDFVRTSVSGIGLLLLGTVVALVMANTGLVDRYEEFWSAKLTIGTADHQITESLRHWVNDCLMALFFFIVGLEIKREVLVGHLRSLRSASFPIAAAVGGVVVPAVVYALLTLGGDGSRGWGIPMATDTAFSIGILTLLATRVQPLLLVFLTAFAIVDDILAVSVIAIFYTDEISWAALGIAAVLLGVLVLANLAGFHRWPIFAFLGVLTWLAIFESGVHGTLAGVLVAMTVPARSWIHPKEFIDRAQEQLDKFRTSCAPGQSMLSNNEQQEAAEELEHLLADVETPITHFQHTLNPWVAYGVLPLFAFANAGIPLRDGLGDALGSPITWGVIAGLVLAKPIGIVLFAWLSVRLGLAGLPESVRWSQIGGVAMLGGIGFTMSLFVTELAFGSGPMADEARVGILVGSLVAGLGGYLVLRQVLPAEGEADGLGDEHTH